MIFIFFYDLQAEFDPFDKDIGLNMVDMVFTINVRWNKRVVATEAGHPGKNKKLLFGQSLTDRSLHLAITILHLLTHTFHTLDIQYYQRMVQTLVEHRRVWIASRELHRTTKSGAESEMCHYFSLSRSTVRQCLL